MAVTASNLTAGPGDLWTAPVASTEPVGSAAPAAAWIDAGGTTDGVSVSVKLSFLELEVDQVNETPERRLTKRETSVSTNLAETTIENLAVALNEPVPGAAASGVQSIEPDGTISGGGYRPGYRALLFRGPGYGAAPALSQVIVRKALSTEGAEFAYKKDDQKVYKTTWMAHWVSTAVKSVKYSNLTS
jgi:hypothetical protein